MIAEDIEIAVARMFGVRANLIVPNASWGAGIHECDLLICSSAGYLTEVEIKVTKADLKKDGEKRHAHKSAKIKFLFFAIPIQVYERKTEEIEALVPQQAGILVVSKSEIYSTYNVDVRRKPTKNRMARSLSQIERYELARLGALRIWDLKKRLQKVREAMQ